MGFNFNDSVAGRYFKMAERKSAACDTSLRHCTGRSTASLYGAGLLGAALWAPGGEASPRIVFQRGRLWGSGACMPPTGPHIVGCPQPSP